MASYYYNKYEIETSWSPYLESTLTLGSGYQALHGYESYYFSHNGIFSPKGDQISVYPGSHGAVFVSFGGSMTAYTFGGTNTAYEHTYKGDPTTVRGAFIETVMAEEGTYPKNGPHGGYWYIKGAQARTFPELKTRQGSQLKTAADGWVRVSGQLRQIQQIWVRENGQLKEV